MVFYFIFLFFLSVSEGVISGNANRYNLAESFATYLLDDSNPKPRFTNLFCLLLDMYSSGQLIIPQCLIERIRDVEKKVCPYDFQRRDNSQSQENADDKGFDIGYIWKEIMTGKTVSKDEGECIIYTPIEITKNLTGSCIANYGFALPRFVKQRILNSVIPGDNVVFIDSVLIEAFHHIPKPQRIYLNLIISHLARYSNT